MTALSNVSNLAPRGSAMAPRGAAVITPYYEESLAVLERCHRSCQEQEGDWPLRHVMVADGHPRPELAGWDVDHITLPKAHADNGNTPRCLGAISAINQGYWPILFLDADNWFRPWHLKTMVSLHHRHPNADVLAMGRQCALPDGTEIPGMADEDYALRHVDTSCYVFYPSGFRVLPLWGMMPPYLGPVCDRFIREAITNHGLVMAGTNVPSVVFTAHYSWAYEAVGRPVPDDVHDIDWFVIEGHFDQSEIFNRTGVHSSLAISPPCVGAVGTIQQGSSISGPILAKAHTPKDL
ncbi:glycosyltransferase family A protein [Synechococcus sp. UW105]|uniref:glycosyltransferase family A protein n=1 Tax=Synechococcus sp. UW105 TaxID=337067 RepID=UPI000E0E284C|nr:glycosyltransferase family A protein [Synechococcus sp. UW105]